MNTTPPDDTRWHALTRYLTGHLSEREAADVQQRLESDPEWRELFENLRAIWEQSGSPRQEWDAKAAFERIRTRVTQSTAGTPVHRDTPLRIAPLTLAERQGRVAGSRSLWHRAPALRAAAAVVVVAGLGTLAWRAVTHTPTPAELPVTAQAPVHEVRTRPGQSATLTLADGTRIVLAPGSALRYARDFGTYGSRDVMLEGEALFEVTHDERSPFIVRTARAIAHDLGTTFVVRDYAESPNVDVVVAEGVVALKSAAQPDVQQPSRGAKDHAPSDSVVLHASEMGRVEADGRLSSRRGIDVESHLAWARGQLSFVDVPLREVLPRFNRWFDVDIKLGDRALAGHQLTATFTTESPAQAVEILAAALNLRAERRGQSITLYPLTPASR
jgi:ferric-dicitrate binding protein FerR (iron transport regulator)